MYNEYVYNIPTKLFILFYIFGIKQIQKNVTKSLMQGISLRRWCAT